MKQCVSDKCNMTDRQTDKKREQTERQTEELDEQREEHMLCDKQINRQQAKRQTN